MAYIIFDQIVIVINLLLGRFGYKSQPFLSEILAPSGTISRRGIRDDFSWVETCKTSYMQEVLGTHAISLV
jgi:hypothetical protein